MIFLGAAPAGGRGEGASSVSQSRAAPGGGGARSRSLFDAFDDHQVGDRRAAANAAAAW